MSESTLKKVVADVENLKSQLEDSKGYMKTSKACDEYAVSHSLAVDNCWSKSRGSIALNRFFPDLCRVSSLVAMALC
jgi:hypothetical protein